MRVPPRPRLGSVPRIGAGRAEQTGATGAVRCCLADRAGACHDQECQEMIRTLKTGRVHDHWLRYVSMVADKVSRLCRLISVSAESGMFAPNSFSAMTMSCSWANESMPRSANVDAGLNFSGGIPRRSCVVF